YVMRILSNVATRSASTMYVGWKRWSVRTTSPASTTYANSSTMRTSEMPMRSASFTRRRSGSQRCRLDAGRHVERHDLVEHCQRASGRLTPRERLRTLQAQRSHLVTQL